ncbi:GNAT family N-acetyltransferase [Pontibacter roseus]|uniref:GNAT family N-acetyltransferase n=1 Tax=Pontibacter roseus TaxID=336989 RepID=UPI000361BAA0|nr:GNAT family N-acetyltransferase [Pontibacter roseus]
MGSTLVENRMQESFQIVPYSPEYEEALLELERTSPQGYLVKLQTVREHFHSRAQLFDDYQSYVALDQAGTPIASAIGAQVPMLHNGQLTDAGYGFNARVAPSYRNHGLGRELAAHLATHFFEPKQLRPQFTTLRTSNLPVLKLLSKSYRNTSQYEFAYLTFSTARGIKVQPVTDAKPNFHIDLLSCHTRLQDYFQMTDDGLGLWKTYQVYQLKITSISPLARASFWMENLLKNNQRVMPEPDVVLKTMTAFNLNETNIHTLPAVALQLYKEGINYLQICCQPDDYVYKALHRSALNVYGYYLVSTDKLSPKDTLTLDIRCL